MWLEFKKSARRIPDVYDIIRIMLYGEREKIFMAKIIIFGIIDTTPLYLSVDGRRERLVSGKWPRYMDVTAGRHRINATTQSKYMRKNDNGDFFSRLDAKNNTSLCGEIDFDEDDALLFQVSVKGTKSVVDHKVMSLSEAENYVDMDALREVGAGKWKAFFLCLFFGIFGVHRFYERQIITGVIYLFTLGLCGIGVVRDLIKILQR